MQTRGFFAQPALPALGKWLKSPVLTRPQSQHAANGGNALPTRMLSVIIPAHNEVRYIGRTLEALQRQNYGWFEVIVVANGCTDGTPEAVRGQCHRLIVLSQKSLGMARNLGARMAKGEVLVFLDADTLLEPMTLRRIAREFTPQYAAGTIRGRPDNPRLRYRLFYALKNTLHRSLLHLGSSGVIICRRNCFLKEGGFDERLEVRENSDLIRRVSRHGRFLYLDDVAATTSMRRFENRGFRRITWLWIKLWFHSFFGDLHQHRYEPVR
jgi:glycosyltransferase involved in cell wall biosynthesis